MTDRYPCAPMACESSAPAPGRIASHRLLDVELSRHESLPLSGDFDWLRAACGQVVLGGVYLCAGAPGSNKSTLERQLALDLTRNGHRVLIISTEEPASNVKAAVIRMTADWPATEVRTAMEHLYVETDLQDLEALPNFVASHVLNPYGKYHGVKLIVVDSVQGSGLQAAAARKWRALYQFTSHTRAARITTLLIFHVTKKNETAGPRSTEHNVDAVLILRKAGKARHFGVAKNRFGPEVHRLVPLEVDEQTITLRPSPYVESFTTVARGYLPGLGLAEVQGAVTLPRWGTNPRIMAPNLPRREIEQLVSCIGQIPKMELDDLTFSVQCRVPDQRRYCGLLGLPLCISLIASFIQRAVPANQIHLGEIDLCRTVRDVPEPLLDELSAAILNGSLPRPLRLLVPPTAVSSLPRVPGVEVIACKRLDDAVYQTWPHLRPQIEPRDLSGRANDSDSNEGGTNE